MAVSRDVSLACALMALAACATGSTADTDNATSATTSAAASGSGGAGGASSSAAGGATSSSSSSSGGAASASSTGGAGGDGGQGGDGAGGAGAGGSVGIACPATPTTVFSETFASPSSSSWTDGSGVAVNGSDWSAYTSAQHGVRIDGGWLEITNERSGFADHGHGYATVPTTGASSPYDTTVYAPMLKDHLGGEVVWTFNMRRDDPDTTDGGFSCSSPASQNAITVGLAYILAGTAPADLAASTSNCNPSATASGYAVIMGGQNAAVRLVAFEQGLRNGNITNIASTAGQNRDNYFSVRVTYTSSTHTWRLEVRDDGTSGFADPAAGAYGFNASNVNATHTNKVLGFAGPYFQTGCSGLCDEVYTARFDNVTVGVRCEN